MAMDMVVVVVVVVGARLRMLILMDMRRGMGLGVELGWGMVWEGLGRLRRIRGMFWFWICVWGEKGRVGKRGWVMDVRMGMGMGWNKRRAGSLDQENQEG